MSDNSIKELRKSSRRKIESSPELELKLEPPPKLSTKSIKNGSKAKDKVPKSEDIEAKKSETIKPQGSWTEEELSAFIEAFNHYKWSEWQKISEFIGTRNIRAVSSIAYSISSLNAQSGSNVLKELRQIALKVSKLIYIYFKIL